VNYDGIVKKLIDEQVRVNTILIVDVILRREYQKLLEDLEATEETMKVKFRDFLQRMVYIKLI